MNEKDFKFFSFLGEKQLKFAFKGYLYHLEDLLDNGKISEEDFDAARERILDIGNDSVRFFKEQARNYYELNN